MSQPTYREFIDRVINEGMEAAKRDYGTTEENASRLEGSLAGFEACRGRDPVMLSSLLLWARTKTRIVHGLNLPGPVGSELWYWRCYEAEVEWVCNVVSAALSNEKKPVIVRPTAAGLLKAAEILGVDEKEGGDLSATT